VCAGHSLLVCVHGEQTKAGEGYREREREREAGARGGGRGGDRDTAPNIRCLCV
jgi:hypothetical protein